MIAIKTKLNRAGRRRCEPQLFPAAPGASCLVLGRHAFLLSLCRSVRLSAVFSTEELLALRKKSNVGALCSCRAGTEPK